MSDVPMPLEHVKRDFCFYLTTAEIQEAIAFADARNKTTINAGVKSQVKPRRGKKGPITDLSVNIDGAIGEVAFAKLTGLPRDKTTHVRSNQRGTDLGDFTLPDGRVVNVKASRCEFPRLLVKASTQCLCDIYCQLEYRVEDGRVFFRGLYDARSVHARKARPFPKEIINHVVEGHELMSLADLDRWLQREETIIIS